MAYRDRTRGNGIDWIIGLDNIVYGTVNGVFVLDIILLILGNCFNEGRIQFGKKVLIAFKPNLVEHLALH